MAIQFEVDITKKRFFLSKAGEALTRANQFLKSLLIRGLSLMTIRAYGYDLVAIYRWLMQTNKKVEDLNQADLLSFIEWQQGNHAQPKSINRRLMTLQLFYRFSTAKSLPLSRGAVWTEGHYRGQGKEGALGLHQRSRKRFIRVRVKTPQKLVEPLTAEQVQLFFQTISRYRDFAIVYLMLLCGLRSHEVLELRLNDITFSDNSIRVKGKGNKERMLPISRSLSDTIQRYLELERPVPCATAHLFAILQGVRRGYPMTTDGLRSLFRHRRTKNSLSKANAHRFRHTFGTDMARQGVRLPVLQKMMGHSSPTVTLQYINLSMADIAAEYNRAVDALQKYYNT